MLGDDFGKSPLLARQREPGVVVTAGPSGPQPSPGGHGHHQHQWWQWSSRSSRRQATPWSSPMSVTSDPLNRSARQ